MQCGGCCRWKRIDAALQRQAAKDFRNGMISLVEGGEFQY
jgi:hypothetical protein